MGADHENEFLGGTENKALLLRNYSPQKRRGEQVSPYRQNNAPLCALTSAGDNNIPFNDAAVLDGIGLHQ